MAKESETRLTIWMSDELKDTVQTQHVDGKTSASEWMRGAARDRMLLESLADERGIELPTNRRERDAVLADWLGESND